MPQCTVCGLPLVPGTPQCPRCGTRFAPPAAPPGGYSQGWSAASSQGPVPPGYRPAFTPASPPPSRRRWALPVTLLAIVVAVGVVFLGWRILVPGERPPETDAPARVTITHDAGGILRVNAGMRIEFPAGALAADTEVTSTPMIDPPAFPAEAVDEAGYRAVTGAQQIDLGGATLQQPATIVVSVAGLRLPAGTDPSRLVLTQYRDTEWYVLPTFWDAASGELRAETERFSPVLVALGFLAVLTVAALSMVGTAVQKRSLTDSRFLEPENVDVTGFSVDAPGGLLRLNKPLKGLDRGSGVVPKYASQLQAEDTPTGMCIDFANLFGSLLIRKGYPVRLVSGTATYTGKKGTQTGGHLWVETVIDQKPYYVDTGSVSTGVRLIPLEEARSRFHLEPGKVFWKELENGSYVTRRQDRYDASWFSAYGVSPAPCTPGVFGDCPITIK